MTEHSPVTPIAAPTLTDWDVQRGEHDRLNAELRPTNKAVVFDALTAAGLTIVTVRFDGYGDSGQIEDIEAKAGAEVVALQPGNVEIAAAVWGHAEPERTVRSVRDADRAACLRFSRGNPRRLGKQRRRLWRLHL